MTTPTQQVINVGAAPNDGQGDPLRTAFIKTNNNVANLFAYFQTSVPGSLVGTAGDFAGMVARDSSYFYWCFGDYDGSSIIWAKVIDSGNIVLSSISNGNSSVSINSANANIAMSVAGTSNVAVVGSGGLTVAGFQSATGNIVTTANVSGGNVNASANIIATGNVSGGNAIITNTVSVAGTTTSVNTGGNVVIATTKGVTSSAASGTLGIGVNLTTGTLAMGTGLTTGGATLGGVNQTGNILIGQSTATQRLNLATGLVGSGNIKTVNIAANGVVGSNSVVTIFSGVAGNSNLTIGGSTGNTTVSYTSNTTVAIANTSGSALSVAGNVVGGNILTAGQVSATGNVSGNYFIGNGFFLTNVVSAGTSLINGTSNVSIGTSGGNVTVGVAGTSNVAVVTSTALNITGAVSATGNVSGNYFIGNGYFLTNVVSAGTSLINGTSNVSIGTSGGNITMGVGGTSNVVVVSSTSATVTGQLSATGNTTGGNLLTSGTVSATTSVITAGTMSAAGNVTGGNIIATANVSAVSFNASGPSIISVFSTSDALRITQTSTGNALVVEDSANPDATPFIIDRFGRVLHGSSTVLGTGAIVPYNQVIGTSSGYGYGGFVFSNAAAGTASTQIFARSNNSTIGTYEVVPDGYAMGFIRFAAVDSANTDFVLSSYIGSYVDGTSNAGNVPSRISFGVSSNISGNFEALRISANGNIGMLPTKRFNFDGVGTNGDTYITESAANTLDIYVGGTNTLRLTSSAANITGALSATGNITGGNLLTNGLLSVAGNVTSGNVSVAKGTLVTGNIINANANGIGNIGSASGYFNTLFAQSTTAVFADLAEMYVSDAEYPAGTVVSFGGNFEVTKSLVSNDTRVAGVVSTYPAYLMNSTQTGNYVVPVALQGRVSCRVVGPVSKGDMMVSAGNGEARSCSQPVFGSVIGKALEDFTNTTGIIEIVVGRL